MKWQWMAAGVLAVATLGACGNDDDGGKEKSADGGYDKAAYCDLVEEAMERSDAGLDSLGDELTEESAKALDAELTQQLAFTESVVAAAPDDLRDAWQSLADVQAAVAEKGREFLRPEVMADYQAMSEDDRLEYLFTEVLGPFEDLDDKDLQAIGTHAESECGITGLFDDA